MCAARPAARRLTLAPSPVEPHARWSSETESYYHSVNSAVATEARPAPSTAEPVWQTFGSRFWALADDLNSDEEEDCRGSPSAGRPSPADRAVAAGSSPPVLAEAEEVSSRVSFSELTGGCSLAYDRSRRTEARQVTATPRRSARTSSGLKPWRGPLPARRETPRATLGEVLAQTKATGRGRQKKYGSRGTQSRPPLQTCLPAPALEKATPPLEAMGSNFKSDRPHPSFPGIEGRRSEVLDTPRIA